MIEMVECGNCSVTKEWASAHTSNEADARKYLAWCEENVRRGYFPHGHSNEVRFIRAKYPEIE